MSLASIPDVWMQHRVSYGETDTMGVLYYAEYLHIFERSRGEFIRAFNTTYKEMEERGLYLPVREAQCRYRSPARFDDLLQIKVTLVNWRKASFNFEYAMYDESRTNLLATGFTQHACVNRDLKPVPAPEWFREIFQPAVTG